MQTGCAATDGGVSGVKLDHSLGISLSRKLNLTCLPTTAVFSKTVVIISKCALLIAPVGCVAELQQSSAPQEVSESYGQSGETCSCSVSWTSGGPHGKARSPTV